MSSLVKRRIQVEILVNSLCEEVCSKLNAAIIHGEGRTDKRRICSMHRKPFCMNTRRSDGYVDDVVARFL